MERGNPFFYYVPDAESSCGSNMKEEGNSSSSSSEAQSNSNSAVPHLAMRSDQDQEHDDLCLPIDNVARIMHQVLPPDADVSNDALDTIQKCASKFISYITSEANKQRKSEKRKHVDVSDLLLAMEKFGLNNYVQPLIVFHDRYLQDEANRLIGGGSNDGMGELYKDGSGASGSGSGNAINNFDPLGYLNIHHFSDD